MRKNTRTLIGASVAVALGAAALLGGAGTLAYWTDTESSDAQTISSGTLELGTIGTSSLTASLLQRVPGLADTPAVAYTGAALVPGDVLRVSIDVPVSISGQNMAAQLAVTPSLTAVSSATSADASLAAALSVSIVSIGDATGATAPTLTPADVAGGVVRVVVEVTFPWGSASQYNGTAGGQVELDAAYSLTQVPAGQVD